MGRKRIEEKHPEIMDLIGKVSDKEIAAQYGCHPATIARVRKQHNVGYAGNPMGSTAGSRARLNEAVRQAKELSKRGRTPKNIIDHGLVILAVRIHKNEDDPEDVRVDVLHCRTGIRVYHKDRLDPRLSMGGELPYFDDWFKCRDFLEEEPGGYRPCLLALSEARKMFRSGFTEPLYGRPNPHENIAHDKLAEAARAGKKVTLSAEEVQALVG